MPQQTLVLDSNGIGMHPAEDAEANVPLLTPETVRQTLQNALDDFERSGKFYAVSTLRSPVNPGLVIGTLPQFSFPLSVRDVQSMIAESHRAPYGKGTQTLVNEAVRKTWEIDGNRVKLQHPKWNAQLDGIVATVCQQMGIAGGVATAEAQLYKLLIYEEGAMFKPHKDSEKVPRMFGTLVVSLPSYHTGGEVEVTFGQKRVALSSATNSEWSSTCMAWFSDVTHEVKPVTSGYRIVLTFNLVAKGTLRAPALASSQQKLEHLEHTITQWKRSRTPEFLVYPLQHKYTAAGINANDLKGADMVRTLAMLQSREKLGLKLCFATLEKVITGGTGDYGWSPPPDEGDWDEERDTDEEDYSDDGDRRNTGNQYDRSARDSYGYGYTMEDISDWSYRLPNVFDLEGELIAQDVALQEKQHLLCDGAYFDRKPDEEESEGWTGNEGGTATHWYRNMALVVMPQENWISLMLNTKTSNPKSEQAIFDLLEAELKRFRTDNTNEEYRGERIQICRLASKYRLSDFPRGFHAIFQCCLETGQKVLAIESIKAVTQSGSLKGAAGECAEVLRCCEAIGRPDLMDAIVFQGDCSDQAALNSIFTVCMSGRRADLAAQVIDLYRRKFSTNAKSFECTRAVLPMIVERSTEFRYTDLEPCLAAVFEGCDELKTCQDLLKSFDDAWKFTNLSDFEGLEQYKSTLCERILTSLTQIKPSHAGDMKTIVTAQGQEWIFDTLLPIAVKKNWAGCMKFALSVSTYMLQPWEMLDPISRKRAYSRLATSTIDAVGLQHRLCDDSIGLVSFHSGLTAVDLVDDALRFQGKLLDKFKAGFNSGPEQMLNLIQVLGNRTGLADVPPDWQQKWFQNLVLIYITNTIGFKPPRPTSWRTRSRGCGCAPCQRLDEFLADSSQNEDTFAFAKKIREHLESQISPRRFNDDDDDDMVFSTKTITIGSPHKLEITKRHRLYPIQHSEWKARVALWQIHARKFAPRSRWLDLLGPQMDDLIQLKVISIQSQPTAAGASVVYQATIPTVSTDARTTLGTNTLRPLTSRDPNLLASTHSTDQRPTRASGAKRAHAHGSPENERPPKRQVPIVDLT